MFGKLFSSDKKKRCPKCGAKSSEKFQEKDTDGDLQDLYKAVNAGSRYSDFGGEQFRCNICKHEFGPKLSDEWERIAKKLGEQRALASIINYRIKTDTSLYDFIHV